MVIGAPKGTDSFVLTHKCYEIYTHVGRWRTSTKFSAHPLSMGDPAPATGQTLFYVLDIAYI